MKIIICGTLVPAEYENKIPQLSNAANRFLMNLVKELRRHNEVVVYSYLGIEVNGTVKNELEKRTGEIIYYYRTKDRLTGALRYQKAVKHALQDAECVITYNVIYAWLFAPDLARRLRKKSMLILADYSPSESYANKLRRLYADIQLWVIRKYDCVVGLSEYTKSYLIPKQRFLCIEGGIDQAVYDYFENDAEELSRSDKSIVFMYAGILEPVTGIDQLVQAFCSIENRDYRLWISGKGSMKAMILDAVKSDDRITYLGCVEYEEYLLNLKKADVLINPRNMQLPENVNNFPSKIMEYLATGKPIISTRFPGWEKFADYIEFCDSSVIGIQKAVETFGQRDHSRQKNREFATGFIWHNQVKKMMKILEQDA